MTRDILPLPPRSPRVAVVLRVPPRVALLLALVLSLPLAALIGIRLKGVDVLGTIDPALAADRSFTDGRLLDVTPFDLGIGGARIALDFEFLAPDGTTRTGRSFAPAATTFDRRRAVTIEFASASPDLARVQGTLCNPFEPGMSRFLGFVVAPSILLMLLWLRDHAQRRGVLVNGHESALEVLGSETIQRRVQLRYRYRDSGGRWHQHTTRIPRGSPLGIALSADAELIRVVHHDKEPARHRLVIASDFRS